MDLEVVGRHALLFDDDAMSAFVNSGDALVEWNSLQIDRYDVRHLLSSPPPPRRRRVPPPPSSHTSHSSFEAELDHERYHDLPPPSDEPESEEGEKAVDAGGYRAVAFSYGNDDEHVDERNVDGGLECPGFRPSFPVPDSLLHCLPPSEKVHQIIARTAMFVCKHGGQSEIILRVKQGDNPTFGFLMPDHHLHAYFRFLVDHREILQSDGNFQMEERRENNEDKKSNAAEGALSLLGSVYGSGEDEDGTTDDNPESNKTLFGEKLNTVSSVASQGSGRSESSPGAGEKDDAGFKQPLPSQKVKAPVIKKNPPVNTSRAGTGAAMKKEDGSSSLSAAVEKLKDSAVGTTSKLIIEPPSDIRRTIDKIVEFIAKNGKQFEATLIEQDSKHGRFPFLLPSNQYHPFYLKVLQKAQESKLSGRSFLSGKDDSAGVMAEKKASLAKENDSLSLAPAGSDLLLESDRKEKFKMVIGKTKKDGQDAHSKETPQDFGVTVDAAAAAAILQAAARGIRNPDLGIVSSAFLSDKLNGQSSEVGQGSSLSSIPSSQPNNNIHRSGQNGEHSASIPVGEEAAGEADSSEAHLTKEEKLKAERRKRAKMFVAMLKGGAAPAKTDQPHGSSVEPQASAVLESGTEVDLSRKGKEGSTSPPDDDILDKNEKLETKLFNDENNERRSKRKYRSRSGRHDEEDKEDKEEEEEEDRKQKPSRKKHRSPREDEEEGGKDRRHSNRKKHHSHHHSSLADKDGEDKEEEKDRKRSRRKHRSRHSSEEDNNGKEEDQSESYHRSSRRKHWSRRSSDEDSEGKEEDDSGRYHRHSRRKHRSHHSSDEDDGGKEDESDSYDKSSRRKHSSHQFSHEEGDEEYNDKERDRKISRKKRRYRSSSRRSRHYRKHRKRHSSIDKDSPQEHKHDKSSDDEYLRQGSHVEQQKESSVEELEEGEIGSKFSDQSQGSGGYHVSREASQDVVSSHQGAPSQPSDVPGVSDDLRAKIRAMLMATRS